MCIFNASGHSKYAFNKPVKRVGKVGLYSDPTLFGQFPGSWKFSLKVTLKKIVDI